MLGNPFQMYLHPIRQPLLSLVNFLFRKGQFDGVVVFRSAIIELDAMSMHVGEIFACFFGRRRAKTFKKRFFLNQILFSLLKNNTFIIFDKIALTNFRMLFSPLNAFGNRVEKLCVRVADRLHNRSDELADEITTHQHRPIAMNKIDEKSFDVRSVLILIRHNHNFAVA